MKTIIYYFTGTGNSLAAAKKIAAIIGNTDLIPIASLCDSEEVIAPCADRVGIVSPVYFTGLPVMVASFAKRLDLTGAGYAFAVLTNGGGGGTSALAQLDSLLHTRSGSGLSSGYQVVMPGNYILMYSPPEGEKQESILASADEELFRIATDIERCIERPLPRSLLGCLLHTLIYSWFVSRVHEKDTTFTVSDDCTSCGICAAICPARNIKLVGTKPVWNHHCELCCGCIHLCPVQAIQAGKGTVRRKRYKNPDIEIRELKVGGESGGEPDQDSFNRTPVSS